jgi:hypothetical protein
VGAGVGLAAAVVGPAWLAAAVGRAAVAPAGCVGLGGPANWLHARVAAANMSKTTRSDLGTEGDICSS